MDCSVGPYSKDIQGPDHVCFGAGELEISFRRTVKVSDNQNASDMPPDLGAFPVYPVAWFGKVPNAMRQKGGVFIPMHSEERLFSCLLTQVADTREQKPKPCQYISKRSTPLRFLSTSEASTQSLVPQKRNA